MKQHFLRSYTQLLIATCHRRNVHAMGGMAAQIPIKNDAAANEAALEKVRADKLREVTDGHDGTWVAHPALVPIAREIFDANMKGYNQIVRKREDVHVTAADLLRVPEGTRTEAGLKQNINIGIQYVEAWLRGMGCVPLHNLMEDAATAEISRTQVWQWIRHGARLEDGREVTVELFAKTLDRVMDEIKTEVGPARFETGRYREACTLFTRLSTQKHYEEFLTLPAYDLLLELEKA
jgi:malate synthase